MFLPIGTNIRLRRIPYANYMLIGLNIIIFSFQFRTHPEEGVLFQPWVKHFMLFPNDWRIWQFLTYAFLHGGIWHIAGNMFFLFIFGNNVNDRLGNRGYIIFYLAGAVLSAAGYWVMHSNSPIPLLGASGAIAAVTGAYLVLFPRSLVTVLYWFFFPGIEVPALYFIVLKMIFLDNVIARTIQGVAYDAHLAGYAFGITGMLILLASGLLKGQGLDLWLLLKQWNRKRSYRETVTQGYDPFTGPVETGPTMRKRIRVKEVAKTPEQLRTEQKIRELRTQISTRISEHNIPTAARLYEELMEIDASQILPRQHLLDIANQLASEGRYAQAVTAYEQLLNRYGTYEQVELMVGLIYSRYLKQPNRAAEFLKKAIKRLSDPTQLQLCKEELAQLNNL